jgi:PIN domain nuclease of toxin-antitoxin system
MTKILLDTQGFIWLGQNPEKISTEAANHIYSEAELFLTAASIWEIAIKVKTGKLRFDLPLNEFVTVNAAKHSISILPISLDSIFKTLDLDLIYRNPFDRIIISQAIVHNLPIVSSDTVFDAYAVKRIW